MESRSLLLVPKLSSNQISTMSCTLAQWAVSAGSLDVCSGCPTAGRSYDNEFVSSCVEYHSNLAGRTVCLQFADSHLRSSEEVRSRAISFTASAVRAGSQYWGRGHPCLRRPGWFGR